jgi:hypothetical protein
MGQCVGYVWQTIIGFLPCGLDVAFLIYFGKKNPPYVCIWSIENDVRLRVRACGSIHTKKVEEEHGSLYFSPTSVTRSRFGCQLRWVRVGWGKNCPLFF